MFYTYILESINHPEKTYIGYTLDINRRLEEHNSNSDKSQYTKKYKPWKIRCYFAFEEEQKAIKF